MSVGLSNRGTLYYWATWNTENRQDVTENWYIFLQENPQADKQLAKLMELHAGHSTLYI